jgi:hypothetical protein
MALIFTKRQLLNELGCLSILKLPVDFINKNHYHLRLRVCSLKVVRMQISEVKAGSSLFAPELPTAKEVMAAICCVATRYALNPSLDLANTAFSLAIKLTAPEYADNKLIVEVAGRLVMQWNEVLREHAYIQSQVMPAQNTLQ